MKQWDFTKIEKTSKFDIEEFLYIISQTFFQKVLTMAKAFFKDDQNLKKTKEKFETVNDKDVIKVF